jgi:hypothetical protein
VRSLPHAWVYKVMGKKNRRVRREREQQESSADQSHVQENLSNILCLSRVIVCTISTPNFQTDAAVILVMLSGSKL